MALDLGAMTVFLYTFTEREKLYDLFELLTGARFTTSYTRVGGQIRDLPPTFIPQLQKFMDDFIPQLDEIDQLLTRNRILSIGPAISELSRASAQSLTRSPVRICGQRYRARSAAQASLFGLREIRFRGCDRQRRRLLRSLSGADRGDATKRAHSPPGD
jgi:NADH:ubiquinone oxidoreductase subunit D